ncbi:MAG: isoprenylcysteine carboxylmethyltransferase family protein [Phycisphaerae bacterium]|nr:isoprenylcysteine carboxylmethyltransferase family protein [Phycisphaerae bacterium]
MSEVEKRAWRQLTAAGISSWVLIFVSAWSLSYWQGWAYWVAFFACTVWLTWYLARKNPELMARRLQAGPWAETERAQQIIQAFASVPFYGMLLISGLDHRFGWSHVPLVAVVAGLVFTVVGYWIVYAAMRANAFASATVEVQPGQHVVSTGPYAAVRHPMYSGALLMLLGTPPAMGSWWGLTLYGPVAVAILWRLVLEERFLAKHLSGYVAYCGQVRWRLLPGVF